MDEIKAFVGHSFTEDDAALVRIFLDYFTQIRGVLPRFSWVHAKEAAPKDVSQKVLSLSAGCNLFIGICTKKEYVVPETAIVPTMLSRSQRKFDIAKAEWKTSDWIIQEIGLFFGRSNHIIILLEQGCRRPGSFQGNIEYIEFDRSTPERAFGRILEMVKGLAGDALIPPGAGATGEVTVPAGDRASPTHEEAETDGALEAPQADWDLEKYKDALFWAMYRKDDDKYKSLEVIFRKSELGKVDETFDQVKASIVALKIIFDYGGSLSDLSLIADKYPQNADIISNYAMALEHFEKHDEAVEKYLVAAALDSSGTESVGYKHSAAVSYANAKKYTEALQLIRDTPLKDETSAAKRARADTIRRIANIIKDDELELEAMEALIDLAPDDIDQRFKLAYKHSQIGNNDLALKHYLAIPVALRTPISWNNLGVAFGRFSIRGKSVAAYRKAADGGETLAMSNLGYLLMNAGFHAEAKAELDAALLKPDFHRNVGEAVSALMDIPKKEETQEETVLEQVEAKAAFMVRLGEALTMPGGLAMEGMWKGPHCDLELALSGSEFVAVGEYDQAQNTLSASLGMTPPKTVHRTVSLQGKVIGNRIDGEIVRTSDEPKRAPTLLSIPDTPATFVAVVNADNHTIAVMENPRSETPTFYELIRQNPT